MCRDARVSLTLFGVIQTEINVFRSPWRWCLLLGSIGWLALVFAPPFAGPYAEVVRWLFNTICHQIPERSFHLFGEPIAACHRCTGLYVGFTAGVLVWPWMPRLASWLAANPRWVGLFLLPLAIDWAIVVNTPASRFVTGLVAAFPVALLPLVAITQRTHSIHTRNQEGVSRDE